MGLKLLANHIATLPIWHVYGAVHVYMSHRMIYVPTTEGSGYVHVCTSEAMYMYFIIVLLAVSTSVVCQSILGALTLAHFFFFGLIIRVSL